MSVSNSRIVGGAISTAAVAILLGGLSSLRGYDDSRDLEGRVQQGALQLLREGQKTFRSDTFGSEAFWGGQLRLHEAIAGARLGGVGPGLSPRMALQLGLKVDAEALPNELVRQIRTGNVNLNDPAITVALLKLNAVVGLTGFFSGDGRLQSIGIQCALCHSNVDGSFETRGIPAGLIGRRQDGWPARDLNVGAIIAFSPTVQPFSDLLGVDQATVRKVLNSWGPGKFDAELILDGKAFRPDGSPAATLIPAAFGLAGVNLHTYTGWGGVAHWNALVANLEMQGSGTFFDPRLNNAEQFPIAAKAGFGNKRSTPDRITEKLPALHFYQLALPVPHAKRTFHNGAVRRGQELFEGRAKCASCHVPPLYTEPGWNMHTPEEIGIDSFQADRSPDRHYRTTPLQGMVAKQKGGFYHDGRFPTLRDVVDHYDRFFGLGLNNEEKNDLVAFIQTL